MFNNWDGPNKKQNTPWRKFAEISVTRFSILYGMQGVSKVPKMYMNGGIAKTIPIWTYVREKSFILIARIGSSYENTA